MSADALIARFEQEKSRALGRSLRRDAGLYYTPPGVAAQVMEVALRSVGAAAVGVRYEHRELPQRLLDTQPQAAAEVALQRPGVLRHLIGDHRQDLVAQRRQLGLDQLRK